MNGTAKYWLFRLAALVLPLVPAPVGHALFGWAGELTFRLNGRARQAVLGNLVRVLGPESDEAERRRVARQAFRTAARNYYDLFRLPRLGAERVDALVARHGVDRFVAAADSGKGVIIVTAHFGNFDLVGQVLVALKCQATLPVEPLHPPSLLRLVTRLRSSQGLHFVPLGPGTLRSVLRVLQSGGVVGLAADRDIQGNGVELPFFGEPARVPTGAVDLARRTGALLVPAFGLRYDDGTYAVFVEPPLAPEWTADAEADRRRVMGQLLGVLERYIRAHPGQWIVFEPLWDR